MIYVAPSKSTLMVKKHCSFQDIFFIGRLVLLQVEVNHQSWETVLVTKLCICKNTHTKKRKNEYFGQKKNYILDF